MRFAVPSLSFAVVLALAGCQSTSLAPDAATVPHAKLASSHVDVDGDRTDVFRLLEVDGRDVIDATDLSVKSVEVDHSHLLAAGRTAHLKVDALAYYANPVRRLAWDSMRIKGTIEFVPAADVAYVMRGSLTPELSSVWVENAATHEVVGKKVSAPGRGAAAAEAASAAAAAEAAAAKDE
jgi:hypothetical protein